MTNEEASAAGAVPFEAPAAGSIPPAMRAAIEQRYLQQAVAQQLANMNVMSAQLIPLGQEVPGEAGEWIRAAKNRIDQSANMLVRVSVMLENKNKTQVGSPEGETE